MTVDRTPAGAMSSPGSGLGRPAVLVSIALHLAGFILVVGVPHLLGRGPISGPVYVVDLVTLPGPPGGSPGPAGPPSPPAQPPSPPPKPATPAKPPAAPIKKTPAKTPEKTIVLPDKSARKPVAKPKTPPAPRQEAEPDAAGETEAGKPTAAPSSHPAPTGTAVVPPGGGPGGSGAGAGGPGAASGGGGSEYDFYIALLDRSIRGAWTRPVYTGRDTRHAAVSLQLSRTGRVIRLDLASPSGFDPLDRSVLRAVREAEPFPPFPLALALETLTVRIEFDLTPEGQDSPGD
jgi:protein TonB